MSDRTIAIVGAGIAGLACADRLAASGQHTVLFEKARGPGGRMSTRRVATATGETAFDHGAQYFTAREPDFVGQVERWQELGVVARWAAAGADAWVGVPAMNSPTKALASALQVHWSTRVDALEQRAGRWRLHTGGPDMEFDCVVLALPAEQALPLVLPFDTPMAQVAGQAQAAPCWTVMVGFGELLDSTGDVLRGGGPALAWAARNSSKPLRDAAENWVLQAGPEWSHSHLEAAPEEVVRMLLHAFARALGASLPRPSVAMAHRWRHARYSPAPGGEGCIWNGRLRLGLCGDWLLGPRVELAWLSGQRLADRILDAARKPAAV